MALGVGCSATRDAHSLAPTGFRLFWKWKSRSGRPPIPLELRQLIRRMAKENPLWGQERIANELWLKLGLRVSPRTVRKYLPRAPAGCPRGDQRWSTFLKNHAQAIVACDFFVTVTCGLTSARCVAKLSSAGCITSTHWLPRERVYLRSTAGAAPSAKIRS